MNELQVVPSAKKEEVKARDEDLKTAVKQALERRGDLKDVDVDVKNGVVRLTGTVENEQQRLDAAIAARSRPGVRAVEDDFASAPLPLPGRSSSVRGGRAEPRAPKDH